MKQNSDTDMKHLVDFFTEILHMTVSPRRVYGEGKLSLWFVYRCNEELQEPTNTRCYI